ncbi:MAG: hypothetical protein ACJAS1_007082 [Oleiphilaceae bacterium]
MPLNVALGGLVLSPDFPVIEGKHEITKSWSITLPAQFNRRIEDEDIVIWKPGFTIYIAVWNNDKKRSHDSLFNSVTEDISLEAFDINSNENGEIKLFSYRLNEDMNDQRVAAFYCYAVSPNGYVQSVMYFDLEKDVDDAIRIWESFEYEVAS